MTSTQEQKIADDMSLNKDLRIFTNLVDKKKQEYDDLCHTIGSVVNDIKIKELEISRLENRIELLKESIDELESIKNQKEVELDKAHEDTKALIESNMEVAEQLLNK